MQHLKGGLMPFHASELFTMLTVGFLCAHTLSNPRKSAPLNAFCYGSHRKCCSAASISDMLVLSSRIGNMLVLKLSSHI